MLACDLGSNTLRIVEFNPLTCKPVRTYEKVVRTAKELHVTKRIGVAAQDNILKALQEASSLFDFTQPSFCVTTEAMRIATNAHDVLARIHNAYGLRFTIISGEEEAYLTSLAIEHALRREGLRDDSYVLFDLGGGSTEITFSRNREKTSQSFPFGILNTAERFSENLHEGITHVLEMIDSFIEHQRPIVSSYQQLIATAGTPTTVAAFLQGLDYAHYDSASVNGTSLHVNDFRHAYDRLIAMDFKEAECYTGTQRRDLVMVGILLCIGIMQKLGFESCIVMDDGLREGVAISNCNKAVSF